jgi:hypothetical protein
VPIKDWSRYPDNWKQISYVIRYFRASGQCEWIDGTGNRCPRRDGEPIPGNKNGAKTVLTVAHLDHTPENNDVSNLLALCQFHHLTYDAEEHARNARRTRRQKVLALYDRTLI